MKKVSFIMSMVLMVSFTLGSSVQAQEKRTGWSPQAKGAVIGAGTGAVAGAVIHKRNRVVGGAVGGAVGAGAGYAIGKHIDNKQKEEARIAAANRAAANRAAASRAAANRSVVAKNASAPAREAAPQNYPVAATYNGFNAANANPAMVYDANGNAIPFMISSAYLPNEHYGDRTKPYYTSEYRRKSW